MTTPRPAYFFIPVMAYLANAVIAQPPEAPPVVDQQARTFTRRVVKEFSARYLLYLPDGYGVDAKARWPLILFLHGADARGQNLERLKGDGLPGLIAAGRRLPFIVVAPQCPGDEWWDSRWSVETLDALLDEVVEKYAVDAERVYLTGLSMGGAGTWRLASEHPDRFAAVAPICGRGQMQQAARLKSVPVWIFHNANDPVVPLQESQKMVSAIQAAGGSVQLTVYPEAGHDAWTQAYADPKLYEWFLQHRRTKEEH